MAQLFRPRANLRARLTLWGVLVALALAAGIAYALAESRWSTGVDRFIEQPVQFSHEHHVGGVGIDCRFCHVSVELEAFAGIPPTETCMHCHAQLFADAPILAPVRASWASGQPIRWWRVHDLPDFVYFDHSAHIHKGVGCETCHGRVDRMPLIRKAEDLTMKWCVDCHRDPAPRLRPPEAIFAMGWSPPPGAREATAAALARFYDVAPRTSCSECHR